MEATDKPRVFVRALFIIAAVIVTLIGVRLAAPILNPIMLALVITLLCNPIFTWLQRRGLPMWVALIMLASGFMVFAMILSSFIGVSLSRLTARLADYQRLISEQETQLRSLLASNGIIPSDLQYFGLLDSISLPRIVGPIIAGVGNVLGNSLIVSVLVLFFLVEMPFFRQRLSNALGEDSPLFIRLTNFGGSVVRFFGIRTYVNLVVALGATISMFVLQIEFALLWGIILFVFSYIPYVGIPIALTPVALLALAQHGPGRAIMVVAAVTLINLSIENLVVPSLLGRGLSISPTVVFISFFFWTWLLGPPGTFLSMPITVLLMFTLDSFEETRWLAQLMGAPAHQPMPTEPVPEQAETPPVTAALGSQQKIASGE
jgi:predicted PurR-regulated permease PerM